MLNCQKISGGVFRGVSNIVTFPKRDEVLIFEKIAVVTSYILNYKKGNIFDEAQQTLVDILNDYCDDSINELLHFREEWNKRLRDDGIQQNDELVDAVIALIFAKMLYLKRLRGGAMA